MDNQDIGNSTGKKSDKVKHIGEMPMSKRPNDSGTRQTVSTDSFQMQQSASDNSLLENIKNSLIGNSEISVSQRVNHIIMKCYRI